MLITMADKQSPKEQPKETTPKEPRNPKVAALKDIEPSQISKK